MEDFTLDEFAKKLSEEQFDIEPEIMEIVGQLHPINEGACVKGLTL